MVSIKIERFIRVDTKLACSAAWITQMNSLLLSACYIEQDGRIDDARRAFRRALAVERLHRMAEKGLVPTWNWHTEAWTLQTPERTKFVYLWGNLQINMRQALGRIIVRNRRAIENYSEIIDRENEAGWGEWSEGFYWERIGEHIRRIERAGYRLQKLTGIVIPEIDHSGDYPRNE